MTAKRKGWGRKIALALVWIALLVWGIIYVLRSADLSLIYSQPVGFWLLQALILLVYLAIGSELVAIILRKMGVACSSPMVFLVMQTSYSSSYLGPVKLGVPLRVVLFNKIFGASYSAATSATLLAQAIRIGILFLVATAGVLVRFRTYVEEMLIALAALVVLAGVGFVVLKLIRRFDFQQRLLDRARNFVLSIYDTTKSVGWQTVVVITGMALVITALLSLSSYLVALQFDQPLSYLDVFFIDAVSIFIGLISFMPMGLGTRDATVIFLLQGAGVPEEISYTIVIVQRMVWSLLPFVIGLISANILGVKSLVAKPEPLPETQSNPGQNNSTSE
jgi:uncharacterized protein (TIRG00374 family)